MLQSILSEKGRILKFFTVGFSGTLINLAFVWLGNAFLFSGLGEPHQTWLSYALAIVVSIFSNYILNYHWTWRDRRGPGTEYFFIHLFKYYLTNMVAASLQFFIANGGVYLLKTLFLEGDESVPVVWKMSASLAGIGMAGIINFLINHFWNFNLSDARKADNNNVNN